MHLRTSLSLGLLAACGASASPPAAVPAPSAPAPASPAAAAAPEPAPAPPALRLPAGARPLRNDVELTIDPAREDFAGTIATELEITAPTRTLWLNGREIAIDEAVFTVGGERLVARALDGGKDYVGLALPRELAPGRATLVIKYRGKMHKDDGDGIYTVKEGDGWYAFTQFEPTDARQAFPTFDEPSYKVPWRLSIRTKKPLVALANTQIEAETDEPGGDKLVRFAETRPLPSYLVAFAVGPFDAVDAGRTRAGQPIRIMVPRGRGADAAFAAQATRPLLDLLEDYFGTPYPYGKLDMVAVPVFNAAAMENPGLVTWRQELILQKPADRTRDRQKAFASVAAHELAHQWFGDYVTLAWWDDTWLNESFASWMASKIAASWQPTWDFPTDGAAGRNMVLGADSLESARVIRQPITTANDITNAFDGITYGKGEAVLTMFERHLGAAVFQRGVRAYLASHAWGNATYEDFVAAMSAAAGKELRPMFDAFILQSGVPKLGFELACAAGKPPTLTITQQRYAPTGSKIDPKRTWVAPVCVRWGAGKATGRDCTMIQGETTELALTAPACPAWVMPNDGGEGYYRMHPRGKLLDALLAAAPKVLSVPERLTLLGDINALVSSGDVPTGAALELVGALARDRSRHIVDASIGIVAGIDLLVPEALRPNYRRLIQKLYRARAHELGWQAAQGEPEDTRALRRSLVPLVADHGEDTELRAQASAQAWRWLDHHDAVDADLARSALAVASRYGDQRLFDRLRADLGRAADRQERGRLFLALGSFTDPKLSEQALALMLVDQFDIRESLGVLQAAFSSPKTREPAYRYVKEHFDAIAARMPAMFRPYLAFTLVALCDDARKADAEAFFGPKLEKLDGGPRILAQALEQLTLCAANRKANTPGVEAFLRRQ